jgi:hypothetical protein
MPPDVLFIIQEMLWMCSSRAEPFEVIALPPGEQCICDYFVNEVMDGLIRVWTGKGPTMQAKATLLHMDKTCLHPAPGAFESHGFIRLLFITVG